MVSLCVMGWGLVLLEHSSAAAVVAAAVTAAAVAAAAVAVGVDPKKVMCFPGNQNIVHSPHFPIFNPLQRNGNFFIEAQTTTSKSEHSGLTGIYG